MANCTRKRHLWEYISLSNGFSAVKKWISSKITTFAEANIVFQGEISQLNDEGKAQTQTQASKPLKCGTSTIFDLKI